MAKRKFYHFSDEGHLLSASSNIVITYIVKLLFVLSVDRLSFSIEHGIGSDDSELFRFSGYDFKLYWFEVVSDHEKISLFDRSIGVFEIGYEIGFGEIACDSLNGV